jgi:hypothetical protein
MVGYIFQRPQSDPDFPIPPPFTKQHQRWALGDESIIDVSRLVIPVQYYRDRILLNVERGI